MLAVSYITCEGDEVTEFPMGMEYLAVAKKIVTDDMVRHYIYRANGRLLDPRQLSRRQLRMSSTQLVPVSEDVYNLYVKYVKGTTKSPLNSIERLI